MALIKHITIVTAVLALCSSCIRADRQKDLVAVETGNGYIVKANGRVINQLFVLTKLGKDENERVCLRVVLNHGCFPDKSHCFVAINYNDFVLALNSVIQEASATYHIRQLSSINIDLMSLGEECLRITADYRNKYKKNENCLNTKHILSILWHSKLLSDLQYLLSNNGLTITDIKIENPFFTTWEEFSSYNIIKCVPSKFVTKKVLRAKVYIYCNRGEQ